jgi:hypothetical protein
MCFPQLQGLRRLQLWGSGSGSGQRCAEAGKGTHGSTWRHWDLDILRAAGNYAVGKVGDLDTLCNIVVARWDDLEDVNTISMLINRDVLQ